MNICAFLGSPRKNGNTAKLLTWFLAEAEKKGHRTKLVHLSGKRISGCVECFACQKVKDKPGCSVRDDMQEMYADMLAADVILIAGPVFCWSFSSQTKALLDRTYCLDKFEPKDGTYVSLVEGKRCGLVLTGDGDAFDGADLTVESFNRMAAFHRMQNIGHLAALSIMGDQKRILSPAVKEAGRMMLQKLG